MRRSAARLGDPARPVGSFLFVGPTGVGKTEVGKALAEYLFNSEEALIRFDMSEFGEYHTVSRLVGAPPGYVGYENAGELSEAVRRRPYAVVLFDEVDKAHPQVLTVLLQIMDSGHLTDAQGRKVNFRNTVVLLTANFGTERLRKAGLGFKPGSEKQGMTAEEVRSIVGSELKRHLTPEFINRLDDVIVFEPLTREDMRDIASRMLMRERAVGQVQGFEMRWDDAVVEWLAEHGYTPFDGARPVRNLVQRRVQDEVAQQVLEGRLKAGQTVLIEVVEGELRLSGVDPDPLPEGREADSPPQPEAVEA